VTTAGDAAVSGLLHGLAAGLAMGAYLVVANLLAGQPLPAALRLFALPSESLGPLAALLGHLAVAGVYGLVWGVLWWFVAGQLPVPALLAGPVYGLLLFAIAQLALSAAGTTPSPGWLNLVVAHVLYGLVLGWFSRRRSGPSGETH
jgi:hypothetical protein